MTHVNVNDLVSSETAGRQPSPGFLLTPFGWAAEPLAAMLHAEPSLLPDLFGISRPRMHLIALALAHLDRPVPSGIGCLLARGPARQVLGRVLGGCPAGIKRALGHLPGAVLQRQNYRRLVHLLADPGGAAVLNHAAKIHDLAIEVLGDLPPPLRRSFASTLADWPEKLNGLTAGLQFLVSRGVAANVDELVAKLATVTAWPQLTAMVEAWIAMLPLPETMPPATVGNGRRLDRVDEICCLGRAWQNCLRTYGSAIDAGRSAVYLWEEAGRPAACLVERHGRLGWFLDQVKGPRNIEVEPNQLQVIGAAFAGVGVPGSRVISAIESIIYESFFSGDSGAPPSTAED
jgi:hypothetical protein